MADSDDKLRRDLAKEERKNKAGLSARGIGRRWIDGERRGLAAEQRKGKREMAGVERIGSRSQRGRRDGAGEVGQRKPLAWSGIAGPAQAGQRAERIYSTRRRKKVGKRNITD